MTVLHVASINTHHFNFMALGASAEDATAALLRGWKVHCIEQGHVCDPAHINIEDVITTELAVGQCARDGAPITSPSALIPATLPFTEEEICELLSAADAALADADAFDMVAAKLDLSDDYMVELRDKLSVYLDDESN